MTIDGKIASKTGDPELSDDLDWKEVHKLRKEMDAIIVGKNTILNDNPKLHIKYYDHNGYHRIVVDSKLSIPINSKVIEYQQELYPTIILTTEDAPFEKIKEFEAKNIKIIRVGREKQVDVKKAMSLIYDLGIKKLLLEGGGTLNWSFIINNLVDEMRLTIAPWIIGGEDAISLVEGNGFEYMSQGFKFNLIDLSSRDNYVILRYKRRE
jgi:2,5-diamino-6-(ribosylamino)-4(3H)-pyrimidinone 5'-phosphate reductase